MLHSELMSPAICTFTRLPMPVRPKPWRKAACLPRKFLDLDLQDDHEPVTDFNTTNSTISRYNDLQKLFTKGNGPRPTLNNTEGADPTNLQRDIAEAIGRRRRRPSSNSCSCRKQRNHNTGGGRAAVIMPTGHSAQRPELLQGKDGPRGTAGQRVSRVAVVVPGRDEGVGSGGRCRRR